MTVNVELLERVKHHILEEPLRLDMSIWISHHEKGPYTPACGTIGCIAGWAIELSGGEKLSKEMSQKGIFGQADIATELLGLTPLVAKRVFHVDSWPHPLRAEEWEAEDIEDVAMRRLALARITARRIDHLIETGE